MSSLCFFFSSRRRHTRWPRDWSSDVCSSDLSSLETAQLLQQFVWGTGFAPPIFQDHFEVLEQRVLKDKHLRLIVARQGQRFEAIWFNQGQPVGPQIELAYRLDENHWNGRSRLQLIVEHGQEPGNAPS